MERVIDELNYITNHKHEKTHNMIFSDLNFGMYLRDREISKHLAKLQTEHNYPDFIYISTGKNQKEKIVNEKRCNCFFSRRKLLSSIR